MGARPTGIVGKLSTWVAHAEVGEPFCVAGGDAGFAIEIYHTDGAITGVTIHDGTELVGAHGMLPAEIFLED